MDPATLAPSPARSPTAEFRAGVLAVAPLLVGVVPFGVIYGMLALESGIPPAAAMAMSSVVFAGSSQFILAQLVGQGAAGLVMVASVALVNLRHALYSASVAPALSHLPRRWKLVLAYLLTDEAYATSIGRLGEPGENRHWHLFGAGLGLWSGWQVSTATGILLGAGLLHAVPRVAEVLDFALPLTFIAIVVPMIRSRSAVAAAAVAAAVALLCASWPYKLGLLAAAMAGIAVGWLLARRRGEA